MTRLNKFTHLHLKVALKHANPLSFQQVVIASHRDKYNNNNEEKFGILQELPECDTETMT